MPSISEARIEPPHGKRSEIKIDPTTVAICIAVCMRARELIEIMKRPHCTKFKRGSALADDGGAIMSRVAALCREARELLGSSGSHRLRIALDIAEIECALEQQRLARAETTKTEQPE